MQAPIEAPLPDQLLRRFVQKPPVLLVQAVRPQFRRPREIILQHRTPRKRSHMRRELRIAQLIETPSLAQTVRQLPRRLDRTAQQFAIHSTRVLRPILVHNQRPIRCRRTGQRDHARHNVTRLRRHHQQARGGGTRTRTEQRYGRAIAVEKLDVVVHPFDGHRLVQHAVVAGRILVGRRQKAQRP